MQVEGLKKYNDLETKYKRLEKDFLLLREEGKQKEQRYKLIE